MSPRSTAPINLEHILLALLDRSPMHGYDLYQKLCSEPGVSLVWNIKQGMLYAMLEKLEARGYVSGRLMQSETHLPRKVYALTQAGRLSLSEWIAAPVRRPREVRQEFLARLIIARRYGNETARELIHRQRQACLAWLEELRATLPPHDEENKDRWLVYSFRIQRLEGILDWLNTCELELSGEPYLR